MQGCCFHGQQTCWLLYDACLQCSSPIRLNGLRSRPIKKKSFDLAVVPHHGDIPSALQPRPITAISLWPCSRAHSWGQLLQPCNCASSWRYFSCASRQYWFFLRLMAIIDFSSAYTAICASRQYWFILCHTAIINFSSAYTAIRASRQ